MAELVDRLENGEMQNKPDLYTELMKRVEEAGTCYSNTFADVERWKADTKKSANRLLSE